MNTVLLGYIFAFLSSATSTIYVLPKKISGQKPVSYAMLMGAGFFIASSAGFAVYKTVFKIEESLLDPELLYACLGGILYAAASVSFLSAIDRIGLAKATQWKSLQGPLATLMMLLLLSEFTEVRIIFIVLAVLFLLTAATLFTVKETHNNRVDRRGVLYGLSAAFLFGVFAVIQKHLTNKGLLFSQHIYMSLFIFLTTGTYLLIKNKMKKKPPGEGPLIHKTPKDIMLPVTGGMLYYGTAYFSTLAYNYIPGSIAFMINQLSAVWLFLLGVFIFREISFKRHWLRLITGLLFSLMGISMLVLARG